MQSYYSNRHKRPRSANTNFRANRIWKLDHIQTARIVCFHLNWRVILCYMHERRTPVLSCHVCIISYWWGKFEIQCKTLGHALYVNNPSVQERLTRESVCTFMTVRSVVSLMRATWTRHKCLTYFGLWRFDTRSMYECITFIRAPMRTPGWHDFRACARCVV